MTKRIWLDTEFIDDGHTIELLSIGMIDDNGHTLYAEADWTDHTRADEWVQRNVLPHLSGGDTRKTRDQLRDVVVDYAGPNPQFWGWFPSYDWVVVCQLFGRMVDLPSTWPMRINDVAALANFVGATQLPQQDAGHHHALADAYHARAVHQWIESLYGHRIAS